MADRLVGLLWPGSNPFGVPTSALLRGSWQQTGGAGSHAIKTGVEHQRASVRRDLKRHRCGRQAKAIRRTSHPTPPSVEDMSVDHRRADVGVAEEFLDRPEAWLAAMRGGRRNWRKAWREAELAVPGRRDGG